MSAITDTAHGPLGADGMSMYDSLRDNINMHSLDQRQTSMTVLLAVYCTGCQACE